jgi:hypothetical protein
VVNIDDDEDLVYFRRIAFTTYLGAFDTLANQVTALGTNASNELEVKETELGHLRQAHAADQKAHGESRDGFRRITAPLAQSKAELADTKQARVLAEEPSRAPRENLICSNNNNDLSCNGI